MPSRHIFGVILGAVYDLNRHRDAASFPAHVARVLARVIACESVLYIRIDPAGSSFALSGWPENAFDQLDHDAAVALHARDHPLVAHYKVSRDARAWNLHELITPEQFRHTGLYRQIYKRFGVEYQLAMLLPSVGPGVHAVLLHRRHAPFSAEDRELLDMLWPHLAQAMRNLRALSRVRELATMKTMVEDSGIVVLDRDGRIELCTEQARVWLTNYCPEGFTRRKLDLPQNVAVWVKEQLQELETETAAALIPRGHRERLVLSRGDSFLSLNLIVDHGRGQHLLVLEEEGLRAPPATLGGLGLTGREAEVMTWVAQGKTNPEIGIILEMSARTVQKHLEHVFQKLGVESRTGAILKAWQAGRFASLLQR